MKDQYLSCFSGFTLESKTGIASEMIDYESSISLAIYKFYSNPAVSKEDNSVKKQYEILKSTWRRNYLRK